MGWEETSPIPACDAPEQACLCQQAGPRLVGVFRLRIDDGEETVSFDRTLALWVTTSMIMYVVH